MEDIYTKIGSRIRDRRKELGFRSCSVLALCLWGSDPNPESKRKMMEHIEKGVRKISVEELVTLSDLLDCDVDYLLCRPNCTLPRRETTDIVRATGLSAKAIEKLQEPDYFVRMVDGTEFPVRKETAGMTPAQVLSRLMEIDEFWRVLGNIATVSSEGNLHFIEQFNNHQSETYVDVPGYIETNKRYAPYKDDAYDIMLSSAAKHFSNAAEKLLKDYEMEVSHNAE